MTHISHDPLFFPLWTVVHLFINLISVQIWGGILHSESLFQGGPSLLFSRWQNKVTNNSRWRTKTKLKVWKGIKGTIHAKFTLFLLNFMSLMKNYLTLFLLLSHSSSKLTTKTLHHTIMKVHVDSFVWETHSRYSLKITVFMPYLVYERII